MENLLESASEAATLILKNVDEDKTIHVASHLDADGLAAAGILGRALFRLGATFRLRIERWLDEEIVHNLANEKPPLTIFLDLGSGYLNLLTSGLSDCNIVILCPRSQRSRSGVSCG
jgi:single-stranded-DNA-specific exonuclease